MKNKRELDFLDVTPSNIWCFAQNHPELVVKDVLSKSEEIKLGSKEILQNIVRKSLLARGINKWLKVRLDLIQYKRAIKHMIRKKMKEVKSQKCLMAKHHCLPDDLGYKDYVHLRIHLAYLRGQLIVLQQVRKDLKSLCMTERWQDWENKSLKEMTRQTVSENGLGTEKYELNKL